MSKLDEVLKKFIYAHQGYHDLDSTTEEEAQEVRDNLKLAILEVMRERTL